MLILFFKPYQVGDWVELEDELGQIDEIDILLTKMTTRDNKVVIIPNGEAANEKIINRSKKGPMRVEVPVGIAYDTNIQKARDALLPVISQTTNVVQHLAPDIVVSELADSSVNLVLRGYCQAQHYPQVYADILENAKTALDQADISIPFPHRVVHMVQA